MRYTTSYAAERGPRKLRSDGIDAVQLFQGALSYISSSGLSTYGAWTDMA